MNRNGKDASFAQYVILHDSLRSKALIKLALLVAPLLMLAIVYSLSVPAATIAESVQFRCARRNIFVVDLEDKCNVKSFVEGECVVATTRAKGKVIVVLRLCCQLTLFIVSYLVTPRVAGKQYTLLVTCRVESFTRGR
jgi:hypothetical protein